MITEIEYEQGRGEYYEEEKGEMRKQPSEKGTIGKLNKKLR